MNPLVIIVGVFLFVSGIVLGRQSQSPSSKIFDFRKTFSVASPTPSPKPTDTTEPTPKNSPVPTKTLMQPTIKSTPTSAPTSESSGTTNLNEFQYPGSSVSSTSSTSSTFASTDSPDEITTWYENKIKDSGYTARSTAKTNTNGNVENKLGGGKSGSSVTIDIKKAASDSKTTITVTAGADNSSDVHIKIENNQGYL